MVNKQSAPQEKYDAMVQAIISGDPDAVNAVWETMTWGEVFAAEKVFGGLPLETRQELKRSIVDNPGVIANETARGRVLDVLKDVKLPTAIDPKPGAPVPPANVPSRQPLPGGVFRVPDSANIGRVDRKLVDILRTAAELTGQTVTVTPSGGANSRRSPTSRHNSGFAIDVQLYDAAGKPIPNYQNGPAFAAYEKFAQTARQVQRQRYPELNNQFRWGGYFSGGTGKYGALDLMHFDLKPGAPMAGGSWEKGLTDAQRARWPGADSRGMAAAVARAGSIDNLAGRTEAQIKQTQQFLRDAGFDPKLDVDGLWGPKTDAAYSQFLAASQPAIGARAAAGLQGYGTGGVTVESTVADARKKALDSGMSIAQWDLLEPQVRRAAEQQISAGVTVESTVADARRRALAEGMSLEQWNRLEPEVRKAAEQQLRGPQATASGRVAGAPGVQARAEVIARALGVPLPPARPTRGVAQTDIGGIVQAVRGGDYLAKGRGTREENRTLQKFLNERGYTDRNGNPLREDGVFGRRTKEAVLKYQASHFQFVDGIVGPRTLAQMVRDQSVPPVPAMRPGPTDFVAQAAGLPTGLGTGFAQLGSGVVAPVIDAGRTIGGTAVDLLGLVFRPGQVRAPDINLPAAAYGAALASGGQRTRFEVAFGGPAASQSLWTSYDQAIADNRGTGARYDAATLDLENALRPDAYETLTGGRPTYASAELGGDAGVLFDTSISYARRAAEMAVQRRQDRARLAREDSFADLTPASFAAFSAYPSSASATFAPDAYQQLVGNQNDANTNDYYGVPSYQPGADYGYGPTGTGQEPAYQQAPDAYEQLTGQSPMTAEDYLSSQGFV